MLKDEDRIFKNLYNDLGWEIDKALQRGDWSQTKDFISKGKELLGAVSVPAIGEMHNLSELSTISYRLTLPEDQNFNLNQDRQVFNNNILVIDKEEMPDENASICIDDNDLLKATPYIK